MLVNVSHSTLHGAVGLAEDAIDSGVAGLLLLPPYFYGYHQQDTKEFFLRFREEISPETAVYLYNLPFSGNEISESLARELLATGRFAGIYDASQRWSYFESLIDLVHDPRHRVLIGDDKLYLRARRCGAAGCISGLAAAVPELLVAMERSLRNGDERRADLLDGYLQEFAEGVDRLPPEAGLKAAAVSRGWNFDTYAVPLSEISRMELDRFRGWVREWLPGVLRECGRA